MEEKEFRVSIRTALHESGTKFYQVIGIQDNVSSPGVVVTHWGAANSHIFAASARSNEFIPPAAAGQAKVERSDAPLTRAKSVADAKGKRGYSFGKVSTVLQSGPMFEAWLLQNFHAETRVEIRSALQMGAPHTPKWLREDKSPVKKEVVKPRNELWGSW